MGAKDCFILYADGDPASLLAGRTDLDRGATEELVRRLFPDQGVSRIEDGTLGENAIPEDDGVYAAVWPGLALVCTTKVALDRPSEVGAGFLAEGAGRTTYVHAMHSVVDWFAFGIWGADGRLRRALSVSGGDGEILEDVGDRLAFEQPWWAGVYPALDGDENEDDYPFPFHPLELGEAVLGNLFGFVFEGCEGMPPATVDPFEVTLAGFRLTEPTGLRRLFRRG
jgi:hypothetical protein